MMFGEMPDEVKKEIEEQHQRAHMAQELVQHELETFIQELTLEQLRILRGWLYSMAAETDPHAILCMIYGDINRLYADKAKHCIICQKDHNNIAQFGEDGTLLIGTQDALDADKALQDVTPFNQTMEEVEYTAEEAVARFRDRMNNPAPMEPDPVATMSQMMKEYHIVRRVSDNALVCERCGKESVSMADRMLKDPEDCDGCHHRAAWG